MSLLQEEPIVAIATAPGVGGVGIVRLSGAGVIDIAQRLFQGRLQPRRLSFGTICAMDGTAIDEGLAVSFPAPASFTGEDIVEFHGHGGPVVLGLIVEACRTLGARYARPGEFSERAFVNGKIDLAQAEAIADLIASGSAAAARGALRSLQGGFSRQVDASWPDALLWLRTYVEASLDFPDEEDVDHLATPQVRERLEQTRLDLHALLKQAGRAKLQTEGLEIALLGCPNAGKSSLLNALAERDRAIVSDLPGTTRDLLEVDLVLAGVPVTLVDTAGLRQSSEPIEREGIRRALDRAAQVDVCVLVVDGAEPQLPTLPDALADIPLLVVLNKVDLLTEAGQREQASALTAQLHRGEHGLLGPVAASALTGVGLEDLIQALLEAVGGDREAAPFSARQRHLEALEECARSLGQAAERLSSVGGTSEPELFAEELRQAHEALGRILGRVSADDLLGEIFSTFCIGK